MSGAVDAAGGLDAASPKISIRSVTSLRTVNTKHSAKQRRAGPDRRPARRCARRHRRNDRLGLLHTVRLDVLTKPLVYARDADSFTGVLGMTVTPTAALALVAQLDDPAWSTPLNRSEDEVAALVAEGRGWLLLAR
jgi:hypothetical protein